MFRICICSIAAAAAGLAFGQTNQQQSGLFESPFCAIMGSTNISSGDKGGILNCYGAGVYEFYTVGMAPTYLPCTGAPDRSIGPYSKVINPAPFDGQLDIWEQLQVTGAPSTYTIYSYQAFWYFYPIADAPPNWPI